MITYKNNSDLPADQFDAIKAQYEAFIEGYVNPKDIVLVTVSTITFHGTRYAECGTKTTTGSTYRDHFEIK